MKQGMQLSGLLDEASRQSNVRRDYLVESGSLKVEPDSFTGKCYLKPRYQDHPMSISGFEMNETFHRQMASRLGIDWGYYNKMLHSWETHDLLATNVNYLLEHFESEQRMVRELDGRVRAYLSPMYQRRDNDLVLEKLLEPAQELVGGLKPVSANISDDRMHLKFVTDKLEGEVKVGEVVRAGYMISNSETGFANTSIMGFVEILSCTNGMTSYAPDSFIKVPHRGYNLTNKGFGNTELPRSSIQDRDEQEFWLDMRYQMRSLLDEKKFQDFLIKLREASSREFRPVNDEHIANVVHGVGRAVALSREEQDKVLEHLINGGDYSQWGMAQAITRTSQDIEEYDRASQLELAGGKVVHLAPGIWRQLTQEPA